MVEEGATRIGVATDHVIESFRNALWPGYKTGEGIAPALLAQFHPLEEALAAFGFVVWPMVELEADDALASAAVLSRYGHIADIPLDDVHEPEGRPSEAISARLAPLGGTAPGGRQARGANRGRAAPGTSREGSFGPGLSCRGTRHLRRVSAARARNTGPREPVGRTRGSVRFQRFA